MSNETKVAEVISETLKEQGGVTPGWLLVMAIAYCICPLDFDFIPVVGWLDDVGFLGYAGYKWANS